MALTANSYGNIIVAHSFGESHGDSMGVVVDGFPSGVVIDYDFLQSQLNRRKPGQEKQKNIVSDRLEEDSLQILSGVFQQKTLGTPIAMIVKNSNQKPEDYNSIKESPRVGHADDVWRHKFGHSDHRGGGRSSGRETISRVMVGALCQQLLLQLNSKMEVVAFVKQIGSIALTNEEVKNACKMTSKDIDAFSTRFPSKSNNTHLLNLLTEAKQLGKSYAGVIEVVVKNPSKNLGQPVFHKIKAELASALIGLGACYSFELGSEFDIDTVEGSEFHQTNDNSVYGGIRGGITTGNTIRFRLKFKPTASVKEIAKKGRHDPAVVIRAIPVIESVVYHILTDHLMWVRLDCINENIKI